jgi:hypothetical protein
MHAVDAAGRVVVSRSLSREKFLAWCARLPPGCMVAMEASSGAHHWARELLALGLDARVVSAQLRERSGWQKAVVALANKNARIVWTLMTRAEHFDAAHVSIKSA